MLAITFVISLLAGMINLAGHMVWAEDVRQEAIYYSWEENGYDVSVCPFQPEGSWWYNGYKRWR